MADSEDMKLLASGELDLSLCDFREADLSGMDLSGRNFSGSLFEKATLHGANFRGSNLIGAKVSFIKGSNVNFDDCNLERLHFGYSDLSGSTMRRAKGAGAIFQHARLDNVDLSGADFSRGSIDVDTNLDGVIADQATNFDGLKLLRATSRNMLFQDYDFRNGQLHKRIADVVVNLVGSSSIDHLDDAQFADGTGYAAPASDRVVQFNHNDPEYQSIAQSLEQAIEAVRTTNEHIEAREGVLQALQYAKNLWGRAELPVTLAKIGIVMAVDDALNLAGTTAVSVLIQAIRVAIVGWIGKKLHLIS